MLPGKTPESTFTSGLLKKGASLDELAKEIGVDARGNDDDFSRGKSL
jgi:hypothetical protein